MYVNDKVLTPEIEWKVKGYQCSRCGHKWQRRRKNPEKETDLPLICPACKSPYWNRPKRKKGV